MRFPRAIRGAAPLIALGAAGAAAVARHRRRLRQPPLGPGSLDVLSETGPGGRGRSEIGQPRPRSPALPRSSGRSIPAERSGPITRPRPIGEFIRGDATLGDARLHDVRARAVPRPRPIERPRRPEPLEPLAEPPPVPKRRVELSGWPPRREVVEAEALEEPAEELEPEATDAVAEPEPEPEEVEEPVAEVEAEPDAEEEELEPEAEEPPAAVEEPVDDEELPAEEEPALPAERPATEAFAAEALLHEEELIDEPPEVEEAADELEPDMNGGVSFDELVSESPPVEDPVEDEPPVEEPPIEEPPVEEPPVSLPEDELTSEEPVVEEAAVNGYPSAEEPEEAEREPEEVWEPGPLDDEPEPQPTADDQPTVELKAVRFSREPPQLPGPQRVTITEVVDDLLAPAASSEVVDAGVVEQQPAPPASPQDARLAQSVRDELAAHPGLLPGTVEIEVVGGMVQLHGWVARLDVAGEIEGVVTRVRGVQGVQSFLRLYGS